ncbi:MAG: diguanylate cyclase [Oscillospiraceae bacterium]
MRGAVNRGVVSITFVHVVAMAAVILSAFITFVALEWRGAPRSLPFVYLSLCISLYVLGDFFEVVSQTANAAFNAVLLQYVGLSFVAPLVFLFVWSYCGHRLTTALKVLVPLPGFAALALVATSPYHRLYYKSTELLVTPLGSQLRVQPGPLYYAFYVYVFGLLFFSIGCLLHFAKQNRRARKVALVNSFGVLLPAASGLSYMLKLLPYRVDTTPWVLTITLLILGFSIFRLNLLEILPVAREKVLNRLSDAYILLDDSQNYLDSNEAAKKLFPALRNALMNTPLSEKGGIREHPIGQALSGEEFAVQTAGETHYYRVSRTRLYPKRGRALTSVMLYDVTENKRLMENLNRLATYDSLTQVYNRGTFFKLAYQQYKEAAFKGLGAAVLMLDIDHFKRVNDQYGHRCGDEVLIIVARRLNGRFRQGDVLGRYGGEEFCVFLPDVAPQNVPAVAEGARAIIAGELFECSGGLVLPVTVSVGAAAYNPEKYSSLEAMLSAADNALYRAKQNGRNRVEVWDEPVAFDSCRIY